MFVPAAMHNAAVNFGEYRVPCGVEGESLSSFPVSFLSVSLSAGRDVTDWLIQKYSICEEGK